MRSKAAASQPEPSRIIAADAQPNKSLSIPSSHPLYAPYTTTVPAINHVPPTPNPVFTAEPPRPRVFEPEPRLREKSGLSRSRATEFAVHANDPAAFTLEPPPDLPQPSAKGRKSNLRTLPENEIKAVPFSSGTKRRTPDDVEPEVALPPQVKVAEQTSIRRRPLQALRQGFTPHRRRSKSSSDSPVRVGSLII